VPIRSAGALERYAWAGGALYVVALITESVISLGFKISQDDSAANIANSLDDHHERLVLVFCLCILSVVGFFTYLTTRSALSRSHHVLRVSARSSRSSPPPASSPCWSLLLLPPSS
jgi:hypothetical protein